jgi:hypothetical protein
MSWLTSAWWTAAIGRSLVCEPSRQTSDAILVDNFDPDYLLFERARELRNAGVASRVLVPVTVDPGTGAPNAVAMAITNALAELSRVGSIEQVPIRQVEPITLNAARDIHQYLSKTHIRSVSVVTPLFRSRRSALIYDATLGRAGIRVACVPGASPHEVATWTQTWHGIQNVVEQWAKLQYYRLYVLPFRMRRDEGAPSQPTR